jgi:hypothetical protein
MIKSKFSNQVHAIIDSILTPEEQKLRYPYWKVAKRAEKLKKMTDAEKLEIFNKILKVHDETSIELTNYLQDKRKKKQVQKLREAKKQSA